MNNKNKTQLWISGSVFIFTFLYIVVSALASGLFGNTFWATVLFVIGLFVLSYALYSVKKRLIVCCVAGYLLGLIIGSVINLFNGMWWQNWTIAFALFIIAGIVLELIKEYKPQVE